MKISLQIKNETLQSVWKIQTSQKLLLIIAAFFLCLPSGYSQKKSSKNSKIKEKAISDLDSKKSEYGSIALKIWEYAEPGFLEENSSALLQKTLKDAGFDVEAGVAEIPTAFVATYGSGEPVVGILAEFDALPGLSQKAQPTKEAIKKGGSGHGCGHHLFGTASVAAGIEMKKLMEEGAFSGTVKVFGTPAEEGGSGKVYMVRAGLFDDVDFVVNWHPGPVNATSFNSSLANISAKFRFHGASSHAAAAPERGRSALDGVEAMDNMVNMMREHIPSDTRIHYVITDGGKAPNVVPDFAEVYYYVRNPDREITRSIFDRMINAAKGAALGTETEMEYEITGGVYNLLNNEVLTRQMQKNLEQVGGVNYTPEEIAFGKKIQESFSGEIPAVEMAAEVSPLKDEVETGGSGSTDVGDVSWTVPTVGMSAATWVPGTSAHSWQAVAAGGTDIGVKGMMVAAKTMALMSIDIFTDSDLREQALEEFNNDRGSDFKYDPLLGNRPPALDYRLSNN